MRKSKKFAPTVSAAALESRLCLSTAASNLAAIENAVSGAYKTFATNLEKTTNTKTFTKKAQLDAAVEKDVTALSKSLTSIANSVPGGSQLLVPIQGQLGTSPDFHGKAPSGTLISELNSVLTLNKVTPKKKGAKSTFKVGGTASSDQIVAASKIETLDDVDIAAFAFAGARFRGR